MGHARTPVGNFESSDNGDAVASAEYQTDDSVAGDLSMARRKSLRTCKGRRYQQFMDEGLIGKGRKRVGERQVACSEIILRNFSHFSELSYIVMFWLCA